MIQLEVNYKGVCIWGRESSLIPRIGEQFNIWSEVIEEWDNFIITDIQWWMGSDYKVILMVDKA